MRHLLLSGCLLFLAHAAIAPAALAAEPSGPKVFHVAPNGRADAPGTAERPFQSLDQARDAIRDLKRPSNSAFPGAEVLVHPGEYRVSHPFRLTDADSGTPEAPVVYRAAGPESPRFHGGVRLRTFRPVTDPAVLARLPEPARSQVREVDLAEAGVTNVIPLELGGFSSGRGFRTHPAMELFVDGEPMTLARWPNEGFVKTGEVPGPLTLTAYDRRPGSPEGRFRFDGDRLARWVGEPDAWLYGYWFWDWADSYEKIERIDPEKREITLAKPWHSYGYRKDQRFHAINVLAELDQPGEWYLDRTRRRVLLFPKSDLANASVELSVAPFPFAELDGASHVRLAGLTWECGAGDGVHVQGGSDVRFEGCMIRRMGGTGIDIRGGANHVLLSCDIHTLGRGGIALTGGNRRSLAPSGHRVENCHIHHLSRIDHTYTPGIWMDGVGHVIRHNLIHDVASSALRVEGNEHLVELNEVHHVVLESDDQGAVDMFGNATYRGNVYRHNYWHHIGPWNGTNAPGHVMRAGIRLDDAICGTRVEGNIFQRCSIPGTHFGGVQIHGGKENLVTGNLFADNAAAVSFTPWGEKRWREFVAKSLDASAIDRELYLRRYTDLARVAEGHDQNTVVSNVVARCPKLFLRAPSGLIDARANQELPSATEFAEGPDGRLIWSDADAARLGISSIPFARIGLHEDAWRAPQAQASQLRIPSRSVVKP